MRHTFSDLSPSDSPGIHVPQLNTNTAQGTLFPTYFSWSTNAARFGLFVWDWSPIYTWVYIPGDGDGFRKVANCLTGDLISEAAETKPDRVAAHHTLAGSPYGNAYPSLLLLFVIIIGKSGRRVGA